MISSQVTLSTIVLPFSDSVAMRLDLLLFDADEACLRCPQNSDKYGHHYLACIMAGKTGLYTCIRDEICRLLWGGGFGLKIESLGFLLDEPDRRLADLLSVLSALCSQPSWYFLPRIVIVFVVVSQYRIARGRKAIEDIATTKRLNQATHARHRE